MSQKFSNDPLTETSYFIMLSLADDPKHGYAIMQDVADLSDERVQLSTGTLYGALNRMLENDWVERTQAEAGSRGKKTYRLTATGQTVLEQEVKRLKHLITLAQQRKVEG